MSKKQRRAEKQRKSEQKALEKQEKKFFSVYNRAVRNHAKRLRKDPDFIHTSKLADSLLREVDKLLHAGIGSTSDNFIKKIRVINDKYLPADEKHGERYIVESDAKAKLLDAATKAILKNQFESTKEQQNGTVDKLRQDAVVTGAPTEKTPDQLKQLIEDIESLKEKIKVLVTMSDDLAINFSDPGNAEKLDQTMALQEELEAKLVQAELELNVNEANKISKDENETSTEKSNEANAVPKNEDKTEAVSKNVNRKRHRGWFSEGFSAQKKKKSNEASEPEQSNDNKRNNTP